MTVLRHIRSDQFQFDFLVHTQKACPYDDEARSLGARIIQCPGHQNLLRYLPHFSKILRDYGPYDAVHGHCHRFTGLNLWLADRAGVPVRIAHSHTDLRPLNTDESTPRRLYGSLMDRLIDRYATMGLAASRLAAEDLFGRDWKSNPRRRIFFCGLDFSQFHIQHDRKQAFSELDLETDDKICLHVGRFTYSKNFPFILEVFAIALKREPRLHLVMVGDGVLEQETKMAVSERNLDSRVHFLGSRSDVARWLSIADLFLFPSLHEGLGLALVEAQAAGVPCLISENIPEEAEILPPLVKRLSLSLPASTWAAAAVDLLNQPRTIIREHALAEVENSKFNIRNSIADLERIYLDQQI
jgi:glycosyltransferase involved in cell wall biosynthesis